MKQSDTIKDLALALSKFQGEVTNVTKDQDGFKFNYADLGQILDMVRPLLSKHELALLQGAETKFINNYAYVIVESMLMHSSGEYISSRLKLPLTEAKGMVMAQSMGCIITYMRRYAAAAILGIAQVDTDANEPKEALDPELLDGLNAIFAAQQTSAARRAELLAAHELKSFDQMSAAQISDLINFLTNSPQTPGVLDDGF